MKRTRFEKVDVKSHYILICPPTKQGQSRYRCRHCNHEFECTGRVRLIEHILGERVNTSKHVRDCPNPPPLLIEALLEEWRVRGLDFRTKDSGKKQRLSHMAKISSQYNVALGFEKLETQGGISERKIPSTDGGYRRSISDPPLNTANHPMSIAVTTINEASLNKAVGPSFLPSSYMCFEKLLSLVQILHHMSPEAVELAITLDQLKSLVPVNPALTSSILSFPVSSHDDSSHSSSFSNSPSHQMRCDPPSFSNSASQLIPIDRAENNDEINLFPIASSFTTIDLALLDLLGPSVHRNY